MKVGIFRMAVVWGAVVGSLLIFLPWTLDVRKVEGRSMEPAYHPGKIVVTWKWAYGLPRPFSPGYLLPWSHPSPGDVVVFRAPPGDHYALKRIHTFSDGKGDVVVLLGDNSALSRDSRDFGPLPVEEILGKVLF